MLHAKNLGNRVIPLAILSRILAKSCITLLPELCREGLRMINPGRACAARVTVVGSV